MPNPIGVEVSRLLISCEREVDPRISDFLSENDGDPLDPFVLGHLLLGNGRWGRTEINAA